jgi:hypothetical protein
LYSSAARLTASLEGPLHESDAGPPAPSAAGALRPNRPALAGAGETLRAEGSAAFLTGFAFGPGAIRPAGVF